MLSPEEKFEVFDRSRYSVSNNVIKSLTGNGGVFGSVGVSSGVYHWVVKYVSGTARCCGLIGITTDRTKVTSLFYNTKYSVACHHAKGSINKVSKYFNVNATGAQNKTIEKPLKSGDCIHITLDCTNKKVSFALNEEALFEVADMVISQDTPYYLGVDCDGVGDTCTVLQSYYETAHDGLNLKQLLAELNRMSSHIQKCSQKNYLQSLKLKTLVTLKENNLKFVDDCKQFEQQYEQLKNDINQMTNLVNEQITPNKNAYKEWSTEQIFRYILSVENGYFKKYETVLKQELKKQGIEPADLLDITPNDLVPMGVVNFRDRKLLYKHLQALAMNTDPETEGCTANNNNNTKYVDK